MGDGTALSGQGRGWGAPAKRRTGRRGAALFRITKSGSRQQHQLEKPKKSRKNQRACVCTEGTTSPSPEAQTGLAAPATAAPQLAVPWPHRCLPASACIILYDAITLAINQLAEEQRPCGVQCRIPPPQQVPTCPTKPGEPRERGRMHPGRTKRAGEARCCGGTKVPHPQWDPPTLGPPALSQARTSTCSGCPRVGAEPGGMLRVGWEPSAPWDTGAASELMADGELGGPKRPPQNPVARSEQRLGGGLEAWGMCRQPHGGWWPWGATV